MQFSPYKDVLYTRTADRATDSLPRILAVNAMADFSNKTTKMLERSITERQTQEPKYYNYRNQAAHPALLLHFSLEFGRFSDQSLVWNLEIEIEWVVNTRLLWYNIL